MNNLRNNWSKDRFPKFWIWMKESSVLDLRFGFYIKNYPYGQLQRSKLAHPYEEMIFQTVFVIGLQG